jgi:hypothetical protein
MDEHTKTDVRGGKGRRDEVGRTPVYPATGPYPDDATVITPGEINSRTASRTRNEHAEVHVSDELKGAERYPRRGDEEMEPD